MVLPLSLAMSRAAALTAGNTAYYSFSHIDSDTMFGFRQLTQAFLYVDIIQTA